MSEQLYRIVWRNTVTGKEWRSDGKWPKEEAERLVECCKQNRSQYQEVVGIVAAEKGGE